jgi:hypothetical protein
MSLFDRKSRTIFDILNEAPEDGAADANADAAADAGGDAPTDDTATGDDNAEATNDDGDNTDDMGNDEDFDVDTSIDGDDGGDDTGDDMGSEDNSMDSDMSSGGDLGDEEVNPKNTDIFSTLTKEEQAIKIQELKKLYNNLYIYISDILGKVNDITPDEDNQESIYRVTAALYDLKGNIAQYIEKIFPIKSYIENDVAYNRYLLIIKSITNVMNVVASEMEQKVQKDNKR